MRIGGDTGRLLPGAVLLLALAGCDGAEQGDPVQAFLDQHWRRPLAPQGPPPAQFSPLEASLAPAQCGQCHGAQFRDWQQSLHHQAVGPGLRWQLRLLSQQEGQACLDCHAPLAEQKALLARELDWPVAPEQPPPGHVPAELGHQGVVCAACHVRRHQRFGPPAGGAGDAAMAHDGFTPTPAFEDSRFCASCHQFPQDGPRTAGKLREDTWAQWAASPAAARGETCQSCHMPDGAHQWRGIHDADMVRRALHIETRRRGQEVVVTLANVGAGHHLPTYMVPRIRVQVWQAEPERLLGEQVLGWDVDLSLQQEHADTRLAAGAERHWVLTLSPDLAPTASLDLRVQVQPRAHYRHLFAAMLDASSEWPAPVRQELEQAHEEAGRADFEAWRQSIPNGVIHQGEQG